MTHLLPGATIGILGGGQLARMMAFEGRRMGYRIAVLDPDSAGSAAQVADLHVTGSFDDLEAAKRLAEQSDVVTLDTEHIPAELLVQLEAIAPVRPSAHVLGIIQDRLEQRRFLEAQSAPQVRYAPVSSPDMLEAATRLTGFPCILKTRRSGYDGKGQARVQRAEDLDSAWAAIGEQPAVMESFVDFEREVSVLLARDLQGNVRYHPIAENDHRHHILRTSRVPARISAEMAEQAEALGGRLALALDYVGMMAIELFVTRDGQFLVNEIAPRTHNSGHYTFGACATSQFEQHLRAVCGLPLGDPTLLRPAIMLNLLGELWADGPPAWDAVFAQPTARLHLYGKAQPNRGRKMAHVLVLDDGQSDLDAVVETIESTLERRAAPLPGEAP